MSGRERVWWFSGGQPIVAWRDLPEPPPTPPSTVELDWLEDALKTLTDKQRFVLERSWGINGFEQYSLREIAELMGVTHQTVAEHYDLAMRRLRKHPDINPPIGRETQNALD